jgi:hypothetical protein
VRDGIRPWLPATATALAVTALVGAAGLAVLGHGLVAASSPAPPDLHSQQAVIAAIENYYRVEDQARATGNADLIDAVTAGRTSPANQNLRQFVAEQSARGRRAVTIADVFSDWRVAMAGDAATVDYAIVQRGHDIDAVTGRALEADTSTSKGTYRAAVRLTAGRWLLYQDDLVGDSAG